MYKNCDIDGDGWPDTNVDIDNDGKCDLNCDSDGDGKPDTKLIMMGIEHHTLMLMMIMVNLIGTLKIKKILMVLVK